MSYIKAGVDAQGNDVNLFYQDWGSGSGDARSTVVLIHGWPLSHEMWDYQMTELPNHGIRVIAYDRRGFGKSSKPWDGYEYDTLADDLKAVLDELDLQNVTLVGFSMGGGEVARYMSRHGGARVARVALVSAVTPYLLKTDDNPDGVDQSVFDEILTNLKKDRADFLQTFGKQFYGVSLVSHPVSQAHLEGDFMRAYLASPRATIECAKAFAMTDFRQDLTQINVPTLIIHGDDDKTVPLEASGERTADALPNAHYIVYSGAPHGLFYTERDRLNQDLLAFVQEGVTTYQSTTTSTGY
ncbi:alpha/beta hydrolase [Spirosoma knui]